MVELYCCENCFYDSYLKDRVREEGELGDCDFCESTEVYHIEPKELASYFNPVVGLYTPVEDFMPMPDIEQGRGDMLWEKLQEDWSIFTFEDYGKQEDFLLAMFPGDDPRFGPPHFLTSLVESEMEFWGEHYEVSHEMEKEWNEFTEEIKYKNRFFPQKQLELDFLKKLLTFIEYAITTEIGLFRSRKTVDEKKLAPTEMGKPPSEKAKNSRANPKGISYLYLASDVETAIAEVRPSINDNVSKLGVIGNMKYALINGKKTEATKGARGFCRSCGEIMIARCGDKRVDHWAHKAHHKCDSWWEKETEWHRNWKENFPDEWQEIIHKAPDGEKHIADVKTKEGCVLEFQHSYLNNEERSSRNDFYKKLIWVVDGVRRKTDEPKFQKMIDENSTVIRRKPLLCRVESDKKCKLLKEWHTNKSHVFFDFQKPEVIWFLFSSKPIIVAYLTRFLKQNLLNYIEIINMVKWSEIG